MYQKKKIISLLLALVMILSMGPVPVRAAEADCHSENYHMVQERINEILNTYLGTTQMTEAETVAAVAALDFDPLIEAVIAVEDLENSNELLALTEEELVLLLDANAVFSNFATAVYDRYTAENLIGLFTTHTVGQVTVADSANSSSVSGSTVTITAKGSLFSKKTNTITITNASGSQAQLSFEYSANATSAFTIDGASAAASGSVTKSLAANGTVTIVVTSNSGLSNTTATLTLSNISLTVSAASSNVTFEFDSGLGSVTVGGESVSSGSVKEISGTTGASLVATPSTGARFLGWIDADNKILSTATSYTLVPAQDMTVQAVFAKDGGTPWFGVGAAAQKSASSGLLGLGKLYYYQVGTSYLFDDLNAAATFAESSTSKTIVLMNNGTLPADDYTIPSGVTLLIPFDSGNTMYTTQAQGKEDVTSGNYEKPKEYRVLTMADGANLTINGAMSLSAKHYYAQGSKKHGGSPTGPCSFVKMEGSSNITVNNGGVLYAYGFIYGSGSVTANSGATVYEMFQIADFRGGTQSTDMDNGVFPLSQYYIQNIEVPLTLYSGATEYAYTTVYMSSADFGSSVAFIAKSNAMFNLTSGYVTKQYDGATDRMSVEIYGDLNVSAINLSVGTSSINSKNYELPINGNMTVAVKSGEVSLNQDLAFLPGSRLILDQGATCTLGKGINIYVYDADEWGGYCSPSNLNFVPVAYAPSRTYSRTAADLVDAVVQVDGTANLSNGYAYTTAGGASIISTGSGKVITTAGSQTVTHQIVQGDPSKYVEIPLNPVKLKNADESFTATGGEDPEILGNNLPTYIYKDGKWSLDTGGCEDGCTPGDEPTCVVPQTCTVCGKMLQKAKGHTEVIDEAVPATCTTDGSTEGSHCSVCNEVLVAQTIVAALGHTEVVDAAVAPTCTATGLTEGKHCSVCGEVIAAQEEVAALGHTEVIDAAKAPTCTETGLTEGKHCSVCGEVIVAQEEVAALGHTPAADDGDCTTAIKCSDCGTVTTPAKDAHTPEADDGDCTTAIKCSDCGTVTTPAKDAHTPEADDGDCTTAIKCSDCGTVTTPAKDAHTAGEAVKENETESSYDSVVYCTVCGEELSRETIVIPATGPEVDASLTFYSKDLSLGADIRAVFRVRRTDTTYKSFYIEIEHNGKITTITDPIISGKNFYFPYTLVAKEMADELTLTIYGVKTDDTVCVSTPETWSIKQGAIDKMNTWYGGTEKEMSQCELVANMLNYGAEAQKHFEYNTNDLATDGLDEKYLALIKTETPELNSISKTDDTGFQVTLSSIELNLAERVQILVKYRMPDKNFAKEDYRAEIKRTHTNADGTTTVEIHTVEGKDCIQSGRSLYIFFNELASNYMRDLLEITLYKGDEVITAVQNFSADSVFSDKLNINPSLIYAMMNYGDCAKVVFG